VIELTPDPEPVAGPPDANPADWSDHPDYPGHSGPAEGEGESETVDPSDDRADGSTPGRNEQAAAAMRDFAAQVAPAWGPRADD